MNQGDIKDGDVIPSDISENGSQELEYYIYYGTFIIGPSGSGKTTLCQGLDQFFTAINRNHVLVNLDPANDTMNYETAIDIKDLIKMDDVMEEFHLGPNGALMYCFQFLDDNINWLLQRLKHFKDSYFIFDLPGQIELFLNSPHLKSILNKIRKNDFFELQITTVSLFDVLHCYNVANYITVCLLSINIMINLETPHINVLSKIDLIKDYGAMPARLSYYLEAQDVSHLGDVLSDQNMQSAFNKKYGHLNKELCKLIDSYAQCQFFPLRVQDQASVSSLVSKIDKSNGYFYFIEERKKKFSDLRETVFDFDNVDHNDMAQRLEEEFFLDEQEDRMQSDLEQLRIENQSQSTQQLQNPYIQKNNV